MCWGRCYIVLGFAAGHQDNRMPPLVLPYVATALVHWWDTRMAVGVESTVSKIHLEGGSSAHLSLAPRKQQNIGGLRPQGQ